MQSGHGRYSDDRSPGRLQVGQGVFGTVDRSPEIDIHQSAEHIELHIVEERPHGDAGVAYQDVDTSEACDGRFYQAAAILLAGDIGGTPGHCGPPVRQVAGDFGQFRVVPRPYDDVGAVCGEFIGERPADTRRCSCYHYGLAFEKFLFGHSCMVVLMVFDNMCRRPSCGQTCSRP